MKPIKFDFEKHKRFVLSLFDEDHSKIKYVVTKEEQQRELGLLAETLKREDRFYFVVNLLDFEIQGPPCGIQKWLGYPEKGFTMQFYINQLIHPSRKVLLSLIAEQMFTRLCKGTYPLKFVSQRFSSLVPIRHYDGHYILTRKTSSVFQYDHKNRLIAYLDEFTRVSDFNKESSNLMMYTMDGENEMAFQKKIMEEVLSQFLGMEAFTPKQIEIARLLAYNENITKSEISEKLNRSVNTIDTHYKQFIDTARQHFKIHFHTVQEAAVYLHKEGLI